MKNIIKLTLIFSILYATGNKINFRHITVDKDGLSESTIHDIFQDSKGIIWISTDNGLDKYDGYDIKHYQYLYHDSTTISEGQAGGIFEDSKGNIWVGTSSGTLNKLNPETEKFIRIPVFKIPNNIIQRPVSKIREDINGNIICGNWGWVALMNPETNERQYYYLSDSTYKETLYNQINTLEKSNALIAGIKTPGDGIDSTLSFTLNNPKKIMVVGSGEIFRQRFGGDFFGVDVGVLKNNHGDQLWSQFIKNSKTSAHDGGDLSNRIRIDTLTLSPGTYKIHFISDGGHGHNKWEKFPPKNPDLWGINIYDLSGFNQQIDLSKELDENDVHYFIQDFEVDKSGDLWFATQGEGLVRFNPDSGVVGKYKAEMSGWDKNSNYSVFRKVIQDPYNPDFYWLSSPFGVHRFNIPTGKFRYYLTHVDTNMSNPSHLEFLNEQEIWTRQVSGGIGVFDIKTKNIELFHNSPNDPKSLIDDNINVLTKDKAGAMWVGTENKGISIYDPNYEKFSHIPYAPNTTNALSDPNVTNFNETKDGTIWITTQSSIEKFDPKTGALQNMANTINPDGKNRFQGLVVDGNNIYAGGACPNCHLKNLVSYNIVTKKNTYRHPNQETSNLGGLVSSNDYYDLYLDNRGLLWIVGENTVEAKLPNVEYFVGAGSNLDSIAYPDKSLLKKIKHVAQKVFAMSPRTIKEDQDGNLWIGASGLYKINFETGETTHYTHNPNDPTSISSGAVKNIMVDSRGTVWVGTLSGLNKHNYHKGTFKRYYKEEGGLPNNVITGIAEDKDGYFWISTKGGLCRFNPIQETYENYFAQDGLQSNEFHNNSAFIASDGTVYFGGGNGVTYFKPEKITKNPTPPSVAITSVKKDGIPEILGLNSQNPNSLNVTYKDRGVSFDFTGLNYTRTEKNTYAYKMEGYDLDWINAGSRRFASYTSLPPGDYVFKVKGSNNDGVWNEEGASISVFVSPPPWATWWAYTSYAVMFGLAVYVLVRRRDEANAKAIEENRKSEELEMARQFQLDMLPKSVPNHTNFEIAAALKTATEVGGDYYDFFQQDDGSLFVVTGDATGHGMTAGMVVSVTKSALETVSALSPAELLTRLNKTICNINIGRNKMALNMACFQPSGVQFTSGGMPPAYHCNTSTGHVNEILHVGLPLGSMKNESYSQENISFESGDTLVFLSDGLPEAENKYGEILGYESVMDCIRNNKNEDVETIKNNLLDLGDSWLGGGPPQDDITIVVVKKK
tara:strand:- start:107 stop:3820 length:3714 start_codon:yes stop_codon:yes gene_type:complete